MNNSLLLDILGVGPRHHAVAARAPGCSRAKGREQHLTPLQLPTTFHLSHPALEIRPTNKATIVCRLTTRKGTMQQSVAGFLVMCKGLVEG